MKGNFISVALIVIGAIALAVNLEWIEFDLVALLRKWWPLALILSGRPCSLLPTPAGGRIPDRSRSARC